MNLSHIPGTSSPFEIVHMLVDPMTWLRKRQAQFGDIWRTRLIVPVVFAVGPEANQTVMVTGRDHFSYQHGFGDLAIGKIFDGSLLLKDGAAHKHDRDILQPAVGRLGLSQSLERVQEIWSRGLRDGAVDVYEFARDVTFEVSANALVDLELADLAEWRTLFEQLIAGSMANTATRFPFGALDKGLHARAKLIAKLRPRIEEARRREPRGMLGLLAHHKEPDGSFLDVDAVASHILLLFWAGYDTTASTGGWVLHHLADKPEWQQRLFDEGRRVLGDRPLRVEDQDALVEHTWFLKEIERLCPAVLFFPRRVVDDVVVLGKTVPKGTMLFWSPYLTHVSHFEDGLRFDPDRWSPARGDKQAKSTSLVGFGGGPRICLGKAFALLQLKVLITTILARYRIERVSPGTTVPLPTHRPKDSLIRFVRR